MARETDEDGDGWGEQSRFAAHLDRGWTLLQRGEITTARASAQHALDARPEAPEALLLMGAIAIAEGRLDAAEDYLQRATELDPEYPEPYLELAHLLTFEAKRPLDALQVIDTALDLETLTPLERVDLGVLAVEAALHANDLRAARLRLRTLDGLGDLRDLLDASSSRAGDEDGDEEREILLRLHGFSGLDEDDLGDGDGAQTSSDAQGSQDEPEDDELTETFQRAIGIVLRFARTLSDIGENEDAADWLRAAVARLPDEADGWYLLGEVEFKLGHAKAAALAGVQTLRIDLRAPLPAWVPSPATIQRRTLEMLSRVEHPQVRAREPGAGTDVLVIVQECPSPELLVEGVDPRVPLMALMGRVAQGESFELTGLAVYRRNLALQSADLDEFWKNLEHDLADELAAALPKAPHAAAPGGRAATKKNKSAPTKPARTRPDDALTGAAQDHEVADDASRAAPGADASDPSEAQHQPRPNTRRRKPRLLS